MSRPLAKRQKTTATSKPSPSNDNNEDKHVLFTTWAQERGVRINGVVAAKLPGRGLGLMTTQKIKKDEQILFVPEKAMFKPSQSTLKKNNLSRISAQAQLAISALLAFEPTTSPLRLWQQTWPTVTDFTQCMPLYWRPEFQALVPPPVNLPFDRQRADFEKDWVSVETFCKAEGWSREQFLYYWMIVNSRSFHWKPPKGSAGSMVMCPFIDYMNHGPTDTTCNVFQRSDGYEVLANRDYDPNEEILATYGSHPNDKLLVHYGFVSSAEPGTPPSKDDDIRLDHLILPKLDTNTRDQLQDLGFLGGYALLPATNELCFKTQVAVRAALLTCNEWEYFAGNGEDLTGDKADAVREYLIPLLREYSTDCVKKTEEIGKLRHKVDDLQRGSLDMLQTRWNQISDALEIFIKGPKDVDPVEAYKEKYEANKSRKSI
ncbi:Hypothetical protein R9X50_00466900 [Acrodontium crateriforme]|uniref:SET domain-containing protein n=1 Tax=Acrodontium crateriforme TaxID=150365 RepID=A0AAQ3RAZ0_9PEZI|nr:Hypothetical protein R9X50_00466900 [Acrodontium crateriforme]